MAVRRYNYAQTVIGDCGHVCSIWPQRRLWQDKNRDGRGERVVQVFCETCTRAEYGIDVSEELMMWVRIDDTEEQEKKADKKAARKAAPKKPRTPKPRKLSVWEELMADTPAGESSEMT